MGYHELNPLVHGRELELLSNETSEWVIQTNPVEAPSKILKSAIYGSYIYDGYEYDLEQNLLKEQSRLFRWLEGSAPESEVVWIYTVCYTFHNLKVLTKAEMTNQNPNHLYIDDGFYSLETLKGAIHTQVSNELPESITDSIRGIRGYFEESVILQGIGVVYDRQFLAKQRRFVDKLGYQKLLTEVIAFINLTNITTMARKILRKRTYGLMTTTLSSSGSIEKEVFLNFVDRDMEDYTSFLSEIDYADFLRPVIREGNLDPVGFEQLRGDYLSSLCQETQTQVFEPLPLLAFSNVREVESKGLRLLVIGKKSRSESEAIKKRVGQVYGT